MITALWGTFPRQIERNINELLETAPPNAIKSFQLYATCKNRELFKGDLMDFAKALSQFFSRSRSERRKSDFDAFLERPMDHEIYSRFQIDFRTAAIEDEKLHEIASWAHNLIRVAKKTTAAFASSEILLRTLRMIVNPGPKQKADKIEFDDFCEAWKTTVFRANGGKHDPELSAVIRELRWLDEELKKSERALPVAELDLGLTKTEREWTLAVLKAANENVPAPAFPDTSAPPKTQMQELERIVQLYLKSQTSKHPEILRNRENIRITLIARCEMILGTNRMAA